MLTIDKIITDMNRRCMDSMLFNSHITLHNLKLNEDLLTLLYIMKCQEMDTYVHSLEVAMLAAKAVTAQGKTLECAEDIATAGVIHDIGKLMIQSTVLNKPSKLNEFEFSTIKKHPCMGYELVKNNPFLPEAAKLAVLYHHERLDGSGYPAGLRKNDAMYEVNLIAVCDVMQALMSKRPYKKAYSLSEANCIARSQSLDLSYLTIVNSILKKER